MSPTQTKALCDLVRDNLPPNHQFILVVRDGTKDQTAILSALKSEAIMSILKHAVTNWEAGRCVEIPIVPHSGPVIMAGPERSWCRRLLLNALK